MILAALARLLQFGGAVTLFGAPLFFLYGLAGRDGRRAVHLGWPRWGFTVAALAVLVGGAVSLSIETAAMTDHPADAFNPSALWAVVGGSRFGGAIGLRLGLAALALAAGLAPAGRGGWVSLALVGAGVTASFAWTGHGAMDDGTAGLVHLAADLAHLAAAALWLGALAALAALALSRRIRCDPAALHALETALRRFSGVGTGLVGALIASGLVNSWFLIGPAHAARLLTSLYGGTLLAKLVLFGAMLALAARNRFWLTPRLADGLKRGSPQPAMVALGWSVGLETAAAAGVLALVGVLGTLAPLSM